MESNMEMGLKEMFELIKNGENLLRKYKQKEAKILQFYYMLHYWKDMFQEHKSELPWIEMYEEVIRDYTMHFDIKIDRHGKTEDNTRSTDID